MESKTPLVITLCDKLKNEKSNRGHEAPSSNGFAGARKGKSSVSPRKGADNKRMICPSSALSIHFAFSSTSPRDLFQLAGMEKASPS